MTSDLDSARARPARAFEMIADHLRELMLVGTLRPGDRLPNEFALSSRFSVGRSTVREALRVLSTEGLIVSRRGADGGNFVAVPPPGRVVDFLTGSFSLLSAANEVTVPQLLEVREYLEVPAARSAATSFAPVHIERLEENLARLSSADPTQMYESNRGFHELVLEASGNRLLQVLAQPIFVTLGTRFIRDRAIPEFWVQVIADHREILAAVTAGDAAAAARAMAAHLHNLRSTYELIDASQSVAAARPPGQDHVDP